MSKDWPTKKAIELQSSDTIWIGGEAENLDRNHQAETVKEAAYKLVTAGAMDQVLVVFKRGGEYVRMVLKGDADIPTKPTT
jgi:hypothetical protein